MAAKCAAILCVLGVQPLLLWFRDLLSLQLEFCVEQPLLASCRFYLMSF